MLSPPSNWFVRLEPIGLPEHTKFVTLSDLCVRNAPRNPADRGYASDCLQGGVVLGRSSSSGGPSKSRLEIDSPIISRNHAQLLISKSGMIYVVDLNSLHGTRIDSDSSDSSEDGSIKLRKYVPCLLSEGQHLVLGKELSSSGVDFHPIEVRIYFRYPKRPSSSELPSAAHFRPQPDFAILGDEPRLRDLFLSSEERLDQLTNNLTVDDSGQWPSDSRAQNSISSKAGLTVAELYARPLFIDSPILDPIPERRTNSVVSKEENDDLQKTNTYRIPPSILYVSEDEYDWPRGHSHSDQPSAINLSSADRNSTAKPYDAAQGREVFSVHDSSSDRSSSPIFPIYTALPPISAVGSFFESSSGSIDELAELAEEERAWAARHATPELAAVSHSEFSVDDPVKLPLHLLPEENGLFEPSPGIGVWYSYAEEPEASRSTLLDVDSSVLSTRVEQKEAVSQRAVSPYYSPASPCSSPRLRCPVRQESIDSVAVDNTSIAAGDIPERHNVEELPLSGIEKKNSVTVDVQSVASSTSDRDDDDEAGDHCTINSQSGLCLVKSFWPAETETTDGARDSPRGGDEGDENGDVGSIAHPQVETDDDKDESDMSADEDSYQSSDGGYGSVGGAYRYHEEEQEDASLDGQSDEENDYDESEDYDEEEEMDEGENDDDEEGEMDDEEKEMDDEEEEMDESEDNDDEEEEEDGRRNDVGEEDDAEPQHEVRNTNAKDEDKSMGRSDMARSITPFAVFDDFSHPPLPSSQVIERPSGIYSRSITDRLKTQHPSERLNTPGEDEESAQAELLENRREAPSDEVAIPHHVYGYDCCYHATPEVVQCDSAGVYSDDGDVHQNDQNSTYEVSSRINVDVNIDKDEVDNGAPPSSPGNEDAASISDASFDGPITPPNLGKRSLPDEFLTAPEIRPELGSVFQASPTNPNGQDLAPRPLKRQRSIKSAIGLIVLGAALGSAGTIAGLLSAAD